MQYHYDGSNDVCPLPFVKIKRQLLLMQKGDSLVAITHDAGTVKNLTRWLDAKHYQYQTVKLAQHHIQWTIQG